MSFHRNRVALCLLRTLVVVLVLSACRSNDDTGAQDAGSSGTTAGGGCSSGGGSGGGDGDGDGTRDPCGPQRFQGRGSCEPGPIYYWNGYGCYGLVACECIGPDCDDGYASEEACMAAHADCTSDSVRSCGGFGGGTCGAGEYCEMLPTASCGILDAGGTCQPLPTACDAIYDPVCGCDSQEYGNACEAAIAGVGLASFSTCGEATDA
jgi:hypothetical protein